MKIICDCGEEMNDTGHYADKEKRHEIWSCQHCAEEITVKELRDGEHYEL